MKKRKPWERGYIPPPKVKRQQPVRTPPGWEDWSSKGTRLRRFGYCEGMDCLATILETEAGFELYFSVNGGSPYSGVFRQPDMSHRSLDFLAAWAKVELASLPKPQFYQSQVPMQHFMKQFGAMFLGELKAASYTGYDEATTLVGELGVLHGVNIIKG